VILYIFGKIRVSFDTVIRWFL